MIDKLKYWLKPKEQIFKDCESIVEDFYDGEKHRIFIDRNSSVLFVAHLDTVCTPRFVKRKNEKLWAAGLDDRLGCLIACELGHKYGVDVLLTDHEESGKSTAKYHNCTDYNFIVEFDRSGDDVVTYGLDSKKFIDAIEEFFKIGSGSFSDVCFMETDVCCMNIGIGYHLAHMENSYVNISEMNKQLNKFREFFYKYKDTVFEQDYDYQETQSSVWYNYYNTKHVTQSLYNNGINDCDFCYGPNAEQIHNYFVCESCFEEMITIAYFSGAMDAKEEDIKLITGD
jgi:hypothetical protein